MRILKKHLGLFLLIIISYNANAQWQYLNTGTQRNLTSLHVINPDTLFAGGDSGLVIKSFDGGLNWIDG